MNSILEGVNRSFIDRIKHYPGRPEPLVWPFFIIFLPPTSCENWTIQIGRKKCDHTPEFIPETSMRINQRKVFEQLLNPP